MMQMMRRSQLQSGFSLIEVLVAVVILAIGVVGLVEAMTLSLRSSRDEELHTVAVVLAAGHMELLRSERFIVEGSNDGEFGDEFPDLGWREEIEETSVEGLYKVTVAIELVETEVIVFELETRIFDPPFTSTTETETDPRDARGGGRRRL